MSSTRHSLAKLSLRACDTDLPSPAPNLAMVLDHAYAAPSIHEVSLRRNLDRYSSRRCYSGIPSSCPARREGSPMTVREGWRGRFFGGIEVGDVYEYPPGRTVTTTYNASLTSPGSRAVEEPGAHIPRRVI